MDTVFKKCTPEDFEELRAFSIRTYRETFAPLNTRENMDAYLESAFQADKFRRELEDPHSAFWFLSHDGRTAGYLKLNEASAQTDLKDPDSLEIERIYVAGEFQGRGLGQELMAYAVAQAVKQGKKYVWLGVWEKNAKAIRFYQKNGFYEIGTHSFVMGEDVQTDYVMRKDLT